MKKLRLLLLLPLMLLSGCGEPAISGGGSQEETVYSNFIILCSHTLTNVSRLVFILDPYTKNIYMMTSNGTGDGKGGITPYYNADGQIMKYEEFKEVHVH